MKKFKMSLAEKRPDVWEIWHPTKNGKDSPKNVGCDSNEEYWYICKKGHDWKASAYEVAQGNKCIICAIKKVSSLNCLLNTKPEIAKQWHPTKNNGITPNDIAGESNKKVWWLCPRGHEYESSPNARKNVYSGCNKCTRELQTSFPEQSVYYYIKKVFPDAENGFKVYSLNNKQLELDIFIPCLNLGIEYDGIFHGSSEGKIRDEQKNKALNEVGVKLIRLREGNLPIISAYNSFVIPLLNDSNLEINQAITKLFQYVLHNFILDSEKVNIISNLKINIELDLINIMDNYIVTVKKKSLAEKYPQLASEWHPTKNKNLKPEYFTPYTTKKVWWQCKVNLEHEWKTAISNRTLGGNGCKYCAGQAVTSETCLAVRYPNISIQWDFKVNGDKTPYNSMPGSRQVVWWICPKEHSYDMRINKKVSSGLNCPICTGKRVSIETCLATVNPELAKEWHPTKNGQKTPMDFTAGSSRREFWWRCKDNPEHEWECTIYKRHTRNYGCPYCSGKRVTSENSLLRLNPELAKEWHPSKNYPLTPETVSSNSNRKVWWECKKCKFEWEAVINSRNNNGKVSGVCSNCSNRKATPQNNLSTQCPIIVDDWDYSKNSENPEAFVKGSSKKVWWLCKHNHEEEEQIRYRVRRNGCKECKKLKL